ncbi:MAG TPA: flavoprotein, partial [Ktedonobacteraceae bacterium]
GTSKRTVLLNKRILVGICGGIASYKAVELVSRLQQAGTLVDVIMTIAFGVATAYFLKRKDIRR